MNITIVGIGYVGLVTAAVLSDLGHNVICYDVNETKIKELMRGNTIIYEKGLAELICTNQERLQFSSNAEEAFISSEVIFICVGTPEKEDGSANLKYVYSAVEQVMDNISNDVILIIKSTVPIGTNDEIQNYIIKSNTKDVEIDVVSNPEFLSQGTAVNNMLNADRIIIGTRNEKSRAIISELYEGIDAPIVYTDRCTAEMIKYASNDFLALKISYINEIANLCELLGANVNDVAKGMGLDPRIGNKFLNAGIGYGGSCFPKDTKALCKLADSFGYDLKTIKAAIVVNELQKLKLIEKSRKYYDSLNGVNVAVLGLTFKPGTDDLREAPSIANIPQMISEGANVKAYDPIGSENFKKVMNDKLLLESTSITFCHTPQEALENAEICFIFTEWPEIKSLTFDDFSLMKHAIILDGRNCISDNNIRNVMIYEAIGYK